MPAPMLSLGTSATATPGAPQPPVDDLDLELPEAGDRACSAPPRPARRRSAWCSAGWPRVSSAATLRGPRPHRRRRTSRDWPMHGSPRRSASSSTNPATQLVRGDRHGLRGGRVRAGQPRPAARRGHGPDRARRWSRWASTASPSAIRRRLSGGQQQLVAIAGLLAMRPRHLVLDEPLAQLDPTARTWRGGARGCAAEGASVLVGHAEDRPRRQGPPGARAHGRRACLRQGPAGEVLADPRLPGLGHRGARLRVRLAAACLGADAGDRRRVTATSSSRTVHFVYPDGPPALDGVDLRIRAADRWRSSARTAAASRRWSDTSTGCSVRPGARAARRAGHRRRRSRSSPGAWRSASRTRIARSSLAGCAPRSRSGRATWASAGPTRRRPWRPPWRRPGWRATATPPVRPGDVATEAAGHRLRAGHGDAGARARRAHDGPRMPPAWRASRRSWRGRAEGRTVIAISHDLRFVAERFERVVVLAQGASGWTAARREVFAEPSWPTLASTVLEPTSPRSPVRGSAWARPRPTPPWSQRRGGRGRRLRAGRRMDADRSSIARSRRVPPRRCGGSRNVPARNCAVT